VAKIFLFILPEQIGGASAVHRIIQEVPEANVVLVRVKGLWGSSFSRAYLGKAPPIFPTMWTGIKEAFKNLLFFSPRRTVIIEFVPAPADFPYQASRLELNRYLEKWYNQPDGLTQQDGNESGDSFIQVSYSLWRKKYPQMQQGEIVADERIKLEEISPAIKEKVIKKLSEITEISPESIKPGMSLATDLGLDSLDTAELAAFLSDQFDIPSAPVSELTSVEKVLAIASKQIVCKDEQQEEMTNLKNWKKTPPKARAYVAEGNTIPEVFLNNCARMGKAIACGDNRSGVLSYPQLKMRVLLLADYIRHLPGDYIGIFLPASVGANILVLASHLAGKIPVMINWTVGPRHLETVVKLSNVQKVLSSWGFLDRLDNIDLDGLEDRLIMLEDARHEFGLFDKLRAYWRSKLSTKKILKLFNVDQLEGENLAVLLFTSGTESMPKGVPLTHENILSNQRDVLESIDLYTDDVFFGVLPPFHAFGFTVSSLIPILAGVKAAYTPNPTDGKNLAREFVQWGITVMCGAPTFIKGLLRASTPETVKTMRLCATGAEKAPPELFKQIEELGKGDTLVEGYGITECSPVLTFNRKGEPTKGVGKPLPHVELCVVHPETMAPMPTGAQGLILARGPNVFSGYLNPGILSPFVTLNGVQWYKTGDLGNLDEENRLTISGRMKRFIKIGPEMVSLASIEDALLQAAEKRGWPVSQEGPSLAVSAKELPGEKPKITLFTKFQTTVEEVNRTLKEAGLGNLIKISSVIVLDDIPIMGTGKINYRQLENQYLNKS
jgi:long-chain-fatty-acid--[acyl-carrier-protein] ligase